MLSFEWDESRNRSNQAKHKVSFEEARTVFSDQHALVIDEPERSEKEGRFVILGMGAKAGQLIVCRCCREEKNVVRILSARKATKTESACYGGKEGI